MTRRSRTQRTAWFALSLALVFFAGACGTSDSNGNGGGNGTAPPLGRQVVNGTVDGPPAVTQVSNSLGQAPVSAGAYTVESFGTGRQLAFATDTAGIPVLFGFIDSTHGELNARTTAEVLVYFASGGFLASSEHQELLLELLADMPEIDDFAAALAAALEADPALFGGAGDPAVLADLAARLRDLVESLAAAVDEPIARAYTEIVRRGVVVNPAEPKSGIRIDLVSGINAVTMTNTYRRLAHCYIDRVSTFDAQGNETPAAQKVTDFEVPAIQGLGTTIGTFIDILWGRFAYTERSTDPVELEPVDGAAKTRFRLAVVGPGAGLGDFGELTDAERAKQDEVVKTFVVRDLLLPLILNVLIPNSSLDDYLRFTGGGDLVQDLVGILTTSVPGIWEKSAAGDISGAVFDAYNAIMNSNTLRRSIGEALIPLIEDLADSDTAQRAVGNATSFLRALALVDTLLAVFDASIVGGALLASNAADIWTLDVTAPRINLNPTSAAVGFGHRQDFVVTVPEAGGADVNLVYHWSNTAGFGALTDGIGGHVDDFDSSRDTVTFTANDDDRAGTDTITVEVFELSGPGQSERRSLGKQTATVEVLERQSKFVFTFGGVIGGRIATINEDGSDFQTLASGGDNFGPRWSPDGSKIVWTKRTAEGAFIWMMNADGTGQERIDEAMGFAPSFTPDGRKLGFQRDGEVAVIDLASRQVMQLTPDDDDFFMGAPSFSPDGNTIATQRAGNIPDGDGQRFQYALVTFGAGGVTPGLAMTELIESGANSQARFGPTGQLAAALNDDRDAGLIAGIYLLNGSPAPVHTNDDFGRIPPPGFSFSPDGKQMVVSPTGEDGLLVIDLDSGDERVVAVAGTALHVDWQPRGG